jgi:putative transposase
MQPKSDKAVTPKRGKLVIKPGSIVSVGTEPHQVIDFLSTDTAVCKSLETGKCRSVAINKITVHDDTTAYNEEVMSQELFAVQSKEYERAVARYEVIKPLLELDHISTIDVQERAKETNTGVASIYRWLNKFNSMGVISSLMMKARGWKESRPRLDARVVEIIDRAIDQVYLNKRRSSKNKVIREVEIQCRKAHLSPPHPNTVRNRINKIDERERIRRRGFADKARNKYQPAGGTFPGADYPLAVIQIDHTPVDIIIVDDEHRLPLGRPYLTLAIDVFSRCVTGYYIALEAPNENSVAMCISHSILPKDAWLELHGVDASWDVRGFPTKIHVDNGADFRTETLRRACLEYDIQLEFRPVRQPQYGGHIERLLGSFMKKIHDLPGTTFSSVYEKQNYNSEKMAALTLDELERWLLVLISKYYHNHKHSSLGVPPITKWEEGLWGKGPNAGIGIPSLAQDPITVELDFMPLFHRGIFKDGVRIDGVRYYSDVLNPWIGARDEGTKKGRKFVFRRDPRNISKIWFYDEQLKQYFEIPYADQSLPTMTLWEFNHIKGELRKKGADTTNMHEVALAYDEMNEIASEAEKKTKKARRMAQQAKRAKKNTTPANVVAKTPRPEPVPSPPIETYDEDDEMGLYDDLKPFDEL